MSARRAARWRRPAGGFCKTRTRPGLFVFAAASCGRGWLAWWLLFACSALQAATIVVGDGVASLADAVRRARDGDTILLPSGEYRGDAAVIHQKQLTIRGHGAARPVLIAGGRSAEGKAILVVRDGDILIENIEFRGARVPDGNGAGIRFEKGRLLVRGCAFFDNEIGLLTANFEDARLIIEDSIFAGAPPHAGALHHLLYAGRIASLKVSGSRFHRGHTGHLLKSRAQRTELAYNLLVDGEGGRASYEVDLPNGGDALLVGNVIGQSAHTENRVLVAYGAEGHAWPHSRLRMAHNTLLNDGVQPAWFLRVWRDRLPPGTPVQAVNNLSVGFGVFTLGASGEFAGNHAAWPSMLVAPEALDFALRADSALRGRGVQQVSEALRPRAEFSLPVGTQPLAAPPRWTPGAFQR
ncbi:MAG TPA: hypothetical protein PKB14_05860 [Rubrivivax sp.]|nr:hypothetical protein [Rubrivivax sp.]